MKYMNLCVCTRTGLHVNIFCFNFARTSRAFRKGQRLETIGHLKR